MDHTEIFFFFLSEKIHSLPISTKRFCLRTRAQHTLTVSVETLTILLSFQNLGVLFIIERILKENRNSNRVIAIPVRNERKYDKKPIRTQLLTLPDTRETDSRSRLVSIEGI